MPIAWTKSSRSKITAIRHPHKSDPTDLSFKDAAAAWQYIRGRRLQNAQASCTITATSEFKPLLDAVLRDLDQETPPTVRDPSHELMRMLVLSHDGGDCYSAMTMSFRALVALWFFQGGPAFIPTLFDVVEPFAFFGSYSGMKSELSIQPVAPNPHGHKHPTRLLNAGTVYFECPFWFALRALLFSLPEDRYRQAVEAFTPRREAQVQKKTARTGSDAGLERGYMDAAFSRVPQWAHEDAEAALRENPPQITWELVLLGLTDKELAKKLVAKMYISDYALIGRGYDIIESLGADAAPVFEAYLEKHPTMQAKYKKQLEALIKLANSNR